MRIQTLSILILFTLSLRLQGAEIDAWFNRAFAYDIVAVEYIINNDPSVAASRDELFKNAQHAVFSKDPIPFKGDIELQANGLSINGKKLSFKAYDPSEYKENGCVLKLTFNLENDARVVIYEQDPNRNFDYQQVYLNGDPLVRTRFSLWSSANSGESYVNGKKGSNTIYAISSRISDGNPTYLHLIIGNLQERATSLASSQIEVGKIESKDYMYRICDYLSSYGWLVDGPTMSEGLFYFLQVYTQQTKSEDEDKRQAEIIVLARRWMDRLNDQALIHFIKEVRRRAPSWLSKNLYGSKVKDIAWWSMNRHIASMASIGSDSDVADLTRYMLSCFQEFIDDKDVAKNLSNFYLNGITNVFRSNGLYESIMDYAKKLEQLPSKSSNKNHWHDQIIGASEQRLQAKAQLAGNPEAHQFYSEFNLLLKRGAEDDRAVDSMVNIFRKAGQKLMLEDTSMRSLGTEMLLQLSSDKKLFQKVAVRAADQFNSRIESALQRGSLEEMGELVTSYGLLVRTDLIHKSLMDEYLDRCRYDRARYHALRLIETDNKELQTNAYAKVIIIEDILKISSDEKTIIPNKVLDATTSYKGELKSLRAIHEDLEISSNASLPNSKLGMGKLNGSLKLGIPNSIHNSGNGEYLDNLPYEKQCVEPIYLNNKVYLSSPTYITAYNINKKTVQWSIDQEVAVQPYTAGLIGVSYPASVVNGNIVRLWSLPDGKGFSIRSFDETGKMIWDFYDHQINQIWSPVCTPHSTFGLLFAVVYNNTIKDQTSFALARLNPANGKIDEIVPINTMFNTFSIEKSRHGQHFYSNENSLYGLSGSGTIFKVNRANLQLDWVAGKILRDQSSSLSPAAFIREFENTVLAFMPNIQEWVAVSSRSGRQLWRWKPSTHCYIHTRNGGDSVIFSDEHNVLMCMDPQSGNIIWRKHGMGLKITGEGCAHESHIYIPTLEGIAIYAVSDGQFIGFHKTNYTPNKIRRDLYQWYVLTKTDAYIYDYGDTFDQTPGKQTASLLSNAPLSPKDKTREPLILNDIYPSKEITSPININQDTKFRATSVPHYYIIDRSREQGIALYREAHTDANGKKVGHEIVWVDSKKSYGIYGDKIAFWDANNFRVERIPNREILIQSDIKNDYRLDEVSHVTVSDDTCVIFASRDYKRDVRILFLDLKTGKEKQRIQFGKNTSYVYGTKEYAIVNNEDTKSCICYDLNTGKQRWEYKDAKRKEAARIAPNTLMIGADGEFAIINEENGKVIHEKFKTKSLGATYAQNMFIYGPKDILDLTTGKKVPDVDKVIAAPDTGAAVIRIGESIQWYDQEGSVQLETPYGHVMGMLQSDRYSPYAELKNNIVHISNGCAFASFDRKTGRLLAQHRLGNDSGRFLAFLDNTALFIFGESLYALQANGDFNYSVTYPFVSQLDEQGWPTVGWEKPSMVGTQYWLTNGGTNARHKYAYQIGRDDSFVYVRLIANAPQSPGDSRIFNLSIEYKDENEKNFPFYWNIDSGNQGVTSLSRGELVTSWKKIDKNGNIHCYAKFDRSDISNDSYRGYAPRIHMEIEEYLDGKRIGRYMLGGLAQMGTMHKIGYEFSNKIDWVTKDKDYFLREKIFSNSSDFYPQGETLAEWINSRRSGAGFDNNIAFLKDMVKRCANSNAVPNVIACLFWEHIAQWQATHPDEIDIDSGLAEYRKKVSDELFKFCTANGVKTEAAKYGLSYLTLDAYPYSYDIYAFRAMRTEGSREDNHGFSINTRSDSPFFFRQNRPFTFHYLLGLYHSRPPKFLEKFHISDNNCYFGEFTYHNPDGSIPLINKSLEHKNGINPPQDYQNKSGNEKISKYVYRNKTYNVIDYRRGSRGFAFSFDKITLPEIPDKKFSSEELLLMLENLPSDSSIGLSLAFEYLSVTPEDKRKEAHDVYDIVLRQIGSNPNNRYSLDVIRQLFNHYRGKQLPYNQIYDKIKDHMAKNGMSRGMQRQLFTEFNNTMRGTGRWYNLGVIPSEKEKYLSPLPEDVENVFNVTYKHNDKDWTFLASAKEMSQSSTQSRYRLDNGGLKESAFSYHTMTFDLLEKKKVWFFIKRYNPHRYDASLTVWVDKEKVYEGPMKNADYEPIACSARLEPGKHQILISYKFTRGWDLEFAIGDSYGLPLDIVELPRQIPLD